VLNSGRRKFRQQACTRVCEPLAQGPGVTFTRPVTASRKSKAPEPRHPFRHNPRIEERPATWSLASSSGLSRCACAGDRSISSCCHARQSVPDMELGHWVTGSMGHLGHLSRPGHRVIILTRCETRVFPVIKKMPRMQNVHVKC